MLTFCHHIWHMECTYLNFNFVYKHYIIYIVHTMFTLNCLQLSCHIWCDRHAMGLASGYKLSWGQSFLHVEGTRVSSANWSWAQQNKRRSSQFSNVLRYNYLACTAIITEVQGLLIYKLWLPHIHRLYHVTKTVTQPLRRIPTQTILSSMDHPRWGIYQWPSQISNSP